LSVVIGASGPGGSGGFASGGTGAAGKVIIIAS
jgi:hypothetical protein